MSSSCGNNSDLALRVRGLSKVYTIRHRTAPSATTLAEAIVSRLRHPLRGAAQTEQFWALRDINFDVKKGEVVGIIGRNGAGKSTLLKILSRITEPTAGQIDLFGRVGSLLEVGTGFHQELTGRENIYLNGAILGMKRAEIKKQFDAIVDFAGVEQFLDTPVKRYSSGMYVRLAFAVAAHLRAEILLVDEVLAVGDAEFQKKCLGKMKEVADGGRTVLFVSHNLPSIVSLCDKCCLLSRGSLAASGTPGHIVEIYLEHDTKPASDVDLVTHGRRKRGSRVVFRRIRFIGHKGVPDSQVRLGHDLRIEIEVEPEHPIRCPSLGIGINSTFGQRLATVGSRYGSHDIDVIEGRSTIECTINRVLLMPGTYCLKLAIGNAGGDIDVIEDAAEFEVIPNDIAGTGVLPALLKESFSSRAPTELIQSRSTS